MNQEVTDAVWEMLYSGSRLLGDPMIMGITAENLAAKYNISREAQDQVAVESHNKAEAAIKAGRFKEEIAPLPVAGEKGTRGIIRAGRTSALWFDHGGSGQAQAGFQEGWDGDAGQFFRAQ